MEFGKRLKRQMEEMLPERRDKFLSYKDLKKLVRLISVASVAGPGGGDGRGPPHPVGKAVADFIRPLMRRSAAGGGVRHHPPEGAAGQDMGREGDGGAGGSRPSEVEYAAEMRRVRKGIVDLHGEMVLLVNYSNTNYTGLAKILKKYDKRTGGPAEAAVHGEGVEAALLPNRPHLQAGEGMRDHHGRRLPRRTVTTGRGGGGRGGQKAGGHRRS